MKNIFKLSLIAPLLFVGCSPAVAQKTNPKAVASKAPGYPRFSNTGTTVTGTQLCCANYSDMSIGWQNISPGAGVVNDSDNLFPNVFTAFINVQDTTAVGTYHSDSLYFFAVKGVAGVYKYDKLVFQIQSSVNKGAYVYFTGCWSKDSLGNAYTGANAGHHWLYSHFSSAGTDTALAVPRKQCLYIEWSADSAGNYHECFHTIK